MEEDCELNLKDLVATFSGIYKIYIFALRLILTLTVTPPLPHPGWDATRLKAIHGSSSGLPKSLPDPIENPSRVKEL